MATVSFISQLNGYYIPSNKSYGKKLKATQVQCAQLHDFCIQDVTTVFANCALSGFTIQISLLYMLTGIISFPILPTPKDILYYYIRLDL